MSTKKITVLGTIILVLPLVIFGQTTNPLVITWQANNYFPADYAGKSAATPNTTIIASAELVQSGKLVDITKADIAWYVDDSLTASGVGAKTAVFTAKRDQSGYQSLRVSVKIENSSFENSIRIPIGQPEVVIDFPLPDKAVKAGSRVTLQAIPFFFNVGSLQKLSFDWRVNSKKVQSDGNRILMNVGTPQSDFQNSILVNVTVQNSENPYEFNNGLLNLPIIQ